MKKIIFCIIILFTISLSVFSAVSIDGLIKGKKVSIEYYSPIDGFFNVLFNLDEAKIDIRNKFNITKNINEPGFFILFTNGYPIWLFIFPGDKISIEINYTDSTSKFPSKINIEGSNAKGHELYNSSYSSTKGFLPFKQFFKQLPSSQETLKDNVIRVIDSTMQPFNKLLILKKISFEFYRKIEWDIKSVIAFEAINQFKRLINEERKMNIDSLLMLHLNNQLDSFKNSLYLKIDPTNTNILASTSGLIYSDQFFRDIEREKIYSQAIFDSGFVKIKNRQYLGYITNRRFLESIWGNSLCFSFRVGEVNKDELDLFYKYFPQSKFIPFLEAELQQQNSSPVIVQGDKKSLHDKIIIIKNEEFNSLDDLLKRFFKGKAVFVDLWATWCVPCIIEIPYIKKLQPLFEKYKVTLLNISIDGKAQKVKWENYIMSKQIEGIHILANENLIDNLKNIISDYDLPIPRFLFINKKGEILSYDFLRPSDKRFEAELKKIL